MELSGTPGAYRLRYELPVPRVGPARMLYRRQLEWKWCNYKSEMSKKKKEACRQCRYHSAANVRPV